MAGELRIEVLGELRVERDGQVLSLPRSKKTRALIAYLAVVGKPQRRDHLCRMFWEVPDDPRGSLRWSLHKIRQVTNTNGHARLAADSQSVLLTPETFDLDLRHVESLRVADLDAMEAATLESLATAFRGEFLEGLSLSRCPKFEAWRLYHRNILLQLRIGILRRLIAKLGDRSERALFYAHTLRALADDEGMDLASDSPLVEPRAASQQIRFCETADRVRIAYSVCGSGPPIVRAAHWMSHLQYDWESPVWRHWMDALSDEMMLIRYDERGNGLSDWDVADVSFAAMLADLESVVDAAGLDRFTLLGVSQSCAVSVAYAVSHPERVSGLILYGGFVRGWRRRGDRHEVATHEAMTTLIREGWGRNNPVFRRLFTTMFIPGAEQAQMDWFDELQRITVSPLNAARLHEAFGDIDVSDLLSRVTVPTMVLHARQDAAVPFQSGREFATGIAGAQFVDLDSANHVLLSGEPAFGRFVREVRRFVAETT